MKRQPKYTLQDLKNGFVNILKDSRVVGNAMYTKLVGKWLIFTHNDKYMALTRDKSNILRMYRRKKGLPAKPKLRPLCPNCPLKKVDKNTRKKIRREASRK